MFKFLAEGTYGLVYIAKDEEEGSYVALKKFRTRKAEDGLDFNTIQEIRILRELNHPNILRFIGAFPSERDLYLATEYLPVNLNNMIQVQDKTLSLKFADIKCVLRQILEGVNYLHSNYILHRDLKPNNIMLSSTGIVKLIDFGLAVDYPVDFVLPQGLQPITLWYRPPELLFGALQYGPAVDIWSVGCILAEMVLERPLFAGKNEFHQLQIIADLLGPIVWPGCDKLPSFLKITPTNPPPTLKEFFKALSVDAIDLLSKLLSLDPSKRITAAEALLHPYFQSPPMATLPSDLPIPKDIKQSQGGVTTTLLVTTGMPTSLPTGMATSRPVYAPGTALMKARATGLPKK